MRPPVSIVIPALADRDLLERRLSPLLAEVRRRDAGDEILVIDDTGKDVLRTWISSEYPTVRGVVHDVSRGYGKALVSGARVAKHELVFCMTPEIRLGEGALEPLTEQMIDERTFAVAPGIAGVLHGSSQLTAREPLFVRANAGNVGEHSRPILCVPHAAFLLRRADLLEADRIDALFEPTCLEPMDLCLGAWSRGLRVLEESRSAVEYHRREASLEGSDDRTRAVFEKNRLLAFWKHLDDPELAREHLATLWHNLLDPTRTDWVNELRWLVLALEKLPELAAARERDAAQRG